MLNLKRFTAQLDPQFSCQLSLSFFLSFSFMFSSRFILITSPRFYTWTNPPHLFTSTDYVQTYVGQSRDSSFHVVSGLCRELGLHRV